jgi:uncharacterized protein DUF4291
LIWIKPSFLWMMYRCGGATKPDQERVLAIEITREGFGRALANAGLSHYDRTRFPSETAWRETLRAGAVRVQRDPERDLALNALPHRAIQVGLSGGAVDRYVDEWITGIRDVTPLAHGIQEAAAADPARVRAFLPAERPYPLFRHLGGPDRPPRGPAIVLGRGIGRPAAVVPRVVVQGIKRYAFRYKAPDNLRRGSSPRGALLRRVEHPVRRIHRPRPADSGALIGHTIRRDAISDSRYLE